MRMEFRFTLNYIKPKEKRVRKAAAGRLFCTMRKENLDIPEITLVAILDADKEGFLRSATSLIQTIGRAARNAEALAMKKNEKTDMIDLYKICLKFYNENRKMEV